MSGNFCSTSCPRSLSRFGLVIERISGRSRGRSLILKLGDLASRRAGASRAWPAETSELRLPTLRTLNHRKGRCPGITLRALPRDKPSLYDSLFELYLATKCSSTNHYSSTCQECSFSKIYLATSGEPSTWFPIG